jgi:hypothetical protein
MGGYGRPLPHKQLHLEVLNGANARESQETISGVVPGNATTAAFGIRGNAECAGCSGSGRVRIGNVAYSETAAGGQDPPATEWTQPTGLVVELKPGQPLLFNSAPFRVVAGKTFTLRFDETASSDAADGGYVGLIFCGADGREISRFRSLFRASGETLPSVETDESGTAMVTAEASGPLQIDFAGDAADRPSRLTQR